METQYDGRGRPAQVRYVPGAGTNPNDPNDPDAPNPNAPDPSLTDLTFVSYAYDHLDQPLTIAETRTSGAVTTQYAYDARSRLTSITRSKGSTYSPDATQVRYGAYTAFDAPGEIVAPSGTVTYGYDGFGRVSSVDGPSGRTSVAWEAGGERLATLSSPGQVERRCYDGPGRVSSIVHAVSVPSGCIGASGMVARFDYTYDGRGNRLEETYKVGGGTAEVTEYGYDGADRLTGVRYPDGTAHLYRLGGDGRRQAERQRQGHIGGLGPGAFWGSPGDTVEYEYDTAGGLAGMKELATGESLGTVTTDDAGRVTELKYQGRSKHMKWDAAGRLRKVVIPVDEGEPVTTEYAYDAQGRRVGQKRGDAVERWIWGAREVLEEQDLTPRAADDVAPAPSAVLYERLGALAVKAGGEQLMHDALGSTVGRWTGSGAKLHRYDALGGYRPDATGATGATTAPGPGDPSIGYTGHQWDGTASLVYAKARWYAPELGSFLSRDPVLGVPGNPVTWNAFGYANANPVRFVDPDGRCAFDSTGRLHCLDLGAGAEIGETIRIVHEGSVAARREGKYLKWMFGGVVGAVARMARVPYYAGEVVVAFPWNAAQDFAQPFGELIASGGNLAKFDSNQSLRGGFELLLLASGEKLLVEGASLAQGARATLGKYAKRWSAAGEAVPAGRGALPGAAPVGMGSGAAEMAAGRGRQVRVTQFYDPARGGFGPGAASALESGPTTNIAESVLDGASSVARTWVAPRPAGQLGWFSRMMTGRGTYTHYLEFGVSPAEMAGPGGVKALFSPWQRTIPGGVSLAGRGAVFGQVGPNYGMYAFLGGLGVAGVGLGYYAITQ